MRKTLASLASLALLFLLASAAAFAGGAAEGSTALSGSVKIAGSSTVYPISVAVAEEFNKMHPDVEIPIQSTGTGGGFANFFIPGKTDINDASRPIKDSEIKAAMDNGFEAIEFQVATDGITVVVSPKATWVDDISVEQLAHIWRPDNPARRWSDVKPSWPKAEFELYGPTSASGTFDYFTDVIVGKEGSSRSDYQGTEQDNTIVQAVSGSQYAMGYFGMAYYLENKDRVKALKVEGVAPSIETAKSGVYAPLSRPIFIYVNSQSLKRPEVEAYVRFYLEQTDTELISQIGYVPLTEAEAKANLDKLDQVLAGLK
jgi:phosphate transport system substrate-binding protein